MKCSKCEAEIPEGSKFCVSCGTPVEAGTKAVLSEVEQKSIKGWSWGGFFGVWIFLFVNKQWKLGWKVFGLFVVILFVKILPWFSNVSASSLSSFGGILSIILFIVTIWVAIKGREMVWDSGVYPTYEAFKKRQPLVTKLNIVYFIVIMILSIASFALIAKPLIQNPELMDQRVMQQAFQEDKVRNPDVVEVEFNEGYKAGTTDGVATAGAPLTFTQDKTSSFQEGYRYGFLVSCMQETDNQAGCLKKLLEKGF